MGGHAEQADISLREMRSQIRELNRALEKTPQVTDPSRHEAAATNMAAIVEARSKLIEQLIRTHPQAIRTVMMSPALFHRVNSEAPAQAPTVEAVDEWSGTLEATVADDFQHGRSTTQWYLHSGDVRRQLFFAHPQNLRHQIHRQVVVAGVGTNKVIAVESLHPAIQTAQSNPPGLNCTPTGVENTAVLIMNQPSGGQTYPTGLNASSYWQPIYFGSTPKSANNFWQEASFGLTSGTGTIYTSGTSGPLTFTSNEDCTNTDQLATDALAAAQADGIDFSNFSRISIIYPVNTCSFGGLGTVGCYPADTRISHPYSITWIPIQNYYNTTSYQYWGLVAHELGHNLGLHHSSSLNFGSIPLGAIDYTDPYPSTGTAGPGVGVRTEYGDPYTVMGGGSWTCGAQYTAFNKAEYLTWMNRTSDVQEVTGSGSFLVVPFENTSGLRGLRILRDPLTSSWIWMEYRQALGDYDSNLSTCDSGSNVLQGANVYYESPYSEDGHLYLLDMNAATTPNNFNKGTMIPGTTWQDPYSLLTLNVTAANSAGVNITASYVQPCAALSISSGGVFAAAGGSGTITVTAPNTCSWTASTVDTWITINSGASGTGNGTVSFTLSSNASANQQRNGYITVQRQSVAVAQKGAATFVSNLSPAFQSGLSSILNVGFNDPAGVADIGYVIVKVHGTDCEIEAVPSAGLWYLFLLDPSTNNFSSSMQVGTAQSASNANCTLNAATSTANTNGNQFQLGLGLTFQQSFAGSYRVTSGASDSLNTNPPDISIGTYQVPPPAITASVSQISPSSGKQGATVPIVITGSNTHFTNSSTIGFTGTGVTSSGISASLSTQLNATLTIGANATSGTQTLTVTSGTEVVTGNFTINASGQAQLSTNSITFSKQLQNTTSSAQQVTLTNIGTTTLNVSGIAHSANFGESDNCGTSVAVNAVCTLNITFSPLTAGTLTGTITISDDSPSSPHVITVTGFGDVSTTPSRPARPTRP